MSVWILCHQYDYEDWIIIGVYKTELLAMRGYVKACQNRNIEEHDLWIDEFELESD